MEKKHSFARLWSYLKVYKVSVIPQDSQCRYECFGAICVGACNYRTN